MSLVTSRPSSCEASRCSLTTSQVRNGKRSLRAWTSLITLPRNCGGETTGPLGPSSQVTYWLSVSIHSVTSKITRWCWPSRQTCTSSAAVMTSLYYDLNLIIFIKHGRYQQVDAKIVLQQIRRAQARQEQVPDREGRPQDVQ